jgi:AraC-like DNA-binding protein
MKPQLLKIALQPLQSFSVRKDSVPYFFNALHFHPEIELVYIEEGSGTQFVGNHLQHFKAGDMVFAGSNLPHLWKCDDEYFHPQSKLRAKATVIHFLPEAFGNDFFEMPEHKNIKQLFQKSKMGINIEGETKATIVKFMRELLQLKGAASIIKLLQILDVLANSIECSFLNGENNLNYQTEKESERMNAILQYLFENFSKTIDLETIAQVARLSPNAFCRYFKQRTNKTFGSFLSELRINHACKLIIETDKAIGTICYDSGFNNFSNFNRYFKEQKGVTPLEYRKRFMQM